MSSIDASGSTVAGVVGSVIGGGLLVWRGIAFWTGIALPLFYGTMVVGLLNIGIYGFVGVIAINYAALVIGSGHLVRRRPQVQRRHESPGPPSEPMSEPMWFAYADARRRDGSESPLKCG